MKIVGFSEQLEDDEQSDNLSVNMEETWYNVTENLSSEDVNEAKTIKCEIDNVGLQTQSDFDIQSIDSEAVDNIKKEMAPE